MGRRDSLSRKERQAFEDLVRMYYEFESRDPTSGETGPPDRLVPPDDPASQNPG
jgi:hypothetical protein